MLLQNLSFMEELEIHPLLVICLQLLLTTKIYRVFVRNLQFSFMFFLLNVSRSNFSEHTYVSLVQCYINWRSVQQCANNKSNVVSVFKIEHSN
jgi:hypothetical protein